MDHFLHVLLPLSLLFTIFTITVNAQVPAPQVSALFHLYNSTNGDSWRWRNELQNGQRWNFTRNSDGEFIEDPCGNRWQGLVCSRSAALCFRQTCHIRMIVLEGYGLSGSIPSEVGDFPFLLSINLYLNRVTGTIPREMGNLTFLVDFLAAVNAFTGTIPREIGNLQRLRMLNICFNRLTGTIPRELGNLLDLNFINLSGNRLNGSIPYQLGNLPNLVDFHLGHNLLSGSIPIDMYNLTKLTIFDLQACRLSGPIASEVGELTQLRWLGIQNNFLTGTIPTEIGNLKSMYLLSLVNNYLTGSIPGELWSISTMQGLYLHNNSFIGTLPSEIGNLLLLEDIDLGSNALTRTLPGVISNLIHLTSLNLNNNYLTGPMPREVGRLQKLKSLSLGSNTFTSSVPGEVSNLVNLTWLEVAHNSLTGSVPKFITNFTMLESLFLQSNRFTGSIVDMFHALAHPHLVSLDLSDNLLTGSLGEDLFRLPAMKVLSLSVNCFRSELSDDMCAAREVEVLSLNGLGAADGCAHNSRFPISGVQLFNAIGGSLPACVWHMTRLAVLHAVGNALTGSLVGVLPNNSLLVDLALSHNRIGGVLPLGLQRVGRVDLSFNQISGRVEDSGELWAQQGKLVLEINRLSGRLPVAKLENVSELKVLRGNMFSCDGVSDKDNFEEDYICGSDDLNDSLFVFVAALLVTGCVVVLVAVLSSSPLSSQDSPLAKCLAPAQDCARKLRMYVSYVAQMTGTEGMALQPIVSLCAKFRSAIWLFVQLLGVVLVMSVPVYSTRGGDEEAYSSHSNTYSWFWTLAYLRGVVPAALILLMWTVTLGAYLYIVARTETKPMESSSTEAVLQSNLGSRSSNPATSGDADDVLLGRPVVSASAGLEAFKSALWVGVVLVANAALTITVNSLYIYSTQQRLSAPIQFGIQLSLAVFRLAYACIIIPLLSRAIVDPVSNIRFRGRLLMVANLAIPCLVTAFASPSCFQGLVVAADPVTTPYSVEVCFATLVDENEVTCLQWGDVESESAPVIPPFAYNNQCSSVLLTSFIPVFIIGFSLQLVLTLLVPVICYQANSVKDLTALIRNKVVEGIMLPEHWLDSDNDSLNAQKRADMENDPRLLLKSHLILCFNVLNNVMVLLTFGLCSPVLAGAVVCTAVFKMGTLLVVAGRFTALLSSEEGRSSGEAAGGGGVHFALAALCRVPFPLTEVLQQSFWLVAWSSALFFALVCWDIASDEVGWFESLWIPLWALCFPVLLWTMRRCLSGCASPHDQHADVVAIGRETDVELSFAGSASRPPESWQPQPKPVVASRGSPPTTTTTTTTPAPSTSSSSLNPMHAS